MWSSCASVEGEPHCAGGCESTCVDACTAVVIY